MLQPKHPVWIRPRLSSLRGGDIGRNCTYTFRSSTKPPRNVRMRLLFRHDAMWRGTSPSESAAVHTTTRYGVERKTGLEPAQPAWKAGMLPLNITSARCRKALRQGHRLFRCVKSLKGGMLISVSGHAYFHYSSPRKTSSFRKRLYRFDFLQRCDMVGIEFQAATQLTVTTATRERSRS